MCPQKKKKKKIIIIPIILHLFSFGLKNEIEQVRQHVSQFEVVCRETDHRTSAFANSHMTQRQLLELVLNASATGPDAENARKDQVRQFLDDLEGLTFDHKTSLSEVRYDLVTLTGCKWIWVQFVVFTTTSIHHEIFLH